MNLPGTTRPPVARATAIHDAAHTAPLATVKCGNVGGPDIYWANCAPCWWWCEDDHDTSCFTAVDAQVRADAHNAQHHPSVRA